MSARTSLRVVAAMLVAVAVCGPVPARADEGGGGTAPSTIYAGVRVYQGGWRGTASSCRWEPHNAVQDSPTFIPVVKVEHGIRYQLYEQWCPGVRFVYVWIPDLTTTRLSYHATAYLERLLPAPRASFAPPASAGVVSVGMWFWIAASQWTSVSVTAWIPTPTGNRWATTTARPVALLFDPGDGTLGTGSVRCSGPGTVWRPADGDERASPSRCQYTYRHSSVMAANGSRFPARVTIVWDVSWRSSSGAGGYAGQLRTSSSYGITVREIQALVSA